MLERLLTEQANAASADIDAQPTAEILRIMNEEDRKVAAAVAAETSRIAQAVDAIVAALGRGGRLFYLGAGTSGRLGVLDASECAPTFGVPADTVQGVIAGGERAVSASTEASEDDPAAGAADLRARGFTARDVLCGIAASGRTPYVLGGVDAARALGAVTIGISCTPDSELSRRVDISIAPLTGPEVVAGSTRLKAGTATKLVLNMLTTAAFIRRGFVYGNLMVNVKPTNSKLIARACRIVAAVVPVPLQQAEQLLEDSGRDVRVAIIMGKTGLGRQGAAHLLEQAGGSVSGALEAYARRASPHA